VSKHDEKHSAAARPRAKEPIPPWPEGQGFLGRKSVKYVVFYESAEDVAARAPAFFTEHVARYEKYVADGSLLMIGTFADPQQDGSMAVFASRQAAEEFISGDPFVLNGVVSGWTIKEWNEVLVKERGAGGR
jgi:uncharacterized protein YciI